MFDGLKKKFSNFVNNLTKKEEQKIEEAKEEAKLEPAQPQPVIIEERRPEPVRGEPRREEKRQEPAKREPEHKPEPIVARPIQKTEAKPEPQMETPKPQPQHAVQERKPAEHVKRPEIRPEVPKPARIEEPAVKQEHVEAPKLHEIQKRQRSEPAQEERKEQPKVTTMTRLKGIFTREVRLREEDVEPFIEELRMELLQSDVNYEASEKILDNIKRNLLESPISSRNTSEQITNALTSAVLSILKSKSAIDVVALARQRKQGNELPLKILFIGPNGAGKTTTMAKMAHLFKKNGFSCVLSASDTFRAAAIEQTAIHAGRLGINVIKGTYGADPASIAFDAIAHAKANHIDVVLIDSAGRQETNKSLMEEVKKMVRVAKPDLKIFVGESISGNTLLNQVKEFNAAVGLDGVILTKLDCDAKGGNTLSIISEADVPVIYFGLGEGYDDLVPYDPEFIIRNMIQNN